MPRSPEFGVDLQGFGQHLGPHVPHGITADVQFGQRGVAAQSVEDDGEVGLQLGIGQRQRGQRLQRGKVVQTGCLLDHFNQRVQLVLQY